jgi:predicted flap endonuclease-1-like 5' DNA nuclease
MKYGIEEIEGIGPAYAAKLKSEKIETTDDLLKRCATPKGREEVAAKTGLGHAHILKWTNHADLMRINGIGKQYAELLEAAGVDTVKELRTRRADHLVAKMKEVDAAKHLTREIPAEKEVAKWIEEAAKLPPIMTY